MPPANRATRRAAAKRRPKQRRKRSPKATRPNAQPNSGPVNQGAPTSHTMDGGTYSPEQIAAAMIVVGFPKDVKIIASGLATVRAESSFRRVDNGICCWGPWQLNKNNGGNDANEACAADLICSTQQAKAHWEEAHCFACKSGPNPWQAGTDSGGTSGDQALAKRLIDLDNSDHEKLLAILNTSAAHDAPLDSVGDAITSVVNAPATVAAALADLVELLKTLFTALFSPEFWLRAGKGILGAIAVVAGAVILARAMLGTDLGAAERIGRPVRERREARSAARETERKASQAAAVQSAREAEKARGEKARKAQWWEDMNKRNEDNDIPF